MDLAPYLTLAVLEGLTQAASLALTALGLSLTFGAMRVVNIAHGEFFMLGAVGAWVVAQIMPGPPWAPFAAALIVAPAIVAGLAFAADRAILRRLNYDPEATIIATIGLSYILQQTVLLTFGPDAQAVEPPFYATFRFPWFGWAGYKAFVIVAGFGVALALWWAIGRTRAGLLMRAAQYDRETAQNFGVPVGRIYSGVFALGGALAAFAGVLVAPTTQAHYLMGHDPLLMSFVVVILGGLGSIPGAIAAAVLIGLTEGVVSVFFSPTLAAILSTLAVAFVLAFRPQGLFGRGARA